MNQNLALTTVKLFIWATVNLCDTLNNYTKLSCNAMFGALHSLQCFMQYPVSRKSCILFSLECVLYRKYCGVQRGGSVQFKH